jgi:transcription antitermination factor NusG
LSLLWYAIRVRSNFEKVTHAALEGKGYEAFLPLCRVRRYWGKRTQQVEAPLFSGYTFCRFDASRRLPILTTPGVVSVVSGGSGPIAVDDGEIKTVRAMLASGVMVGPCPFLREGQYVSVVRGPLAGVEGVVIQVKNTYRLVVSVSLLQRSVSAEVESDWVRPVAQRLIA